MSEYPTCLVGINVVGHVPKCNYFGQQFICPVFMGRLGLIQRKRSSERQPIGDSLDQKSSDEMISG